MVHDNVPNKSTYLVMQICCGLINDCSTPKGLRPTSKMEECTCVSHRDTPPHAAACCPWCGQANGCAMAAKSVMPCWCQDVSFPASLLARLLKVKMPGASSGAFNQTKTRPIHSPSHIAKVATSVSEWGFIHSLTLVATVDPNRSKLRGIRPKGSETRAAR